MKRGEKRLLDFLFFFLDMHEIFSKFVALKERLLNFLFLSILCEEERRVCLRRSL